jgi:hypothetical protein
VTAALCEQFMVSADALRPHVLQSEAKILKIFELAQLAARLGLCLGRYVPGIHVQAERALMLPECADNFSRG